MCDSILIVDDDPGIRGALAEMLSDEGYAIHTAHDGMDALRVLRGGLRPCVILLDWMMPVMDGGSFRIQQRGDPAISHLPVVVVTAGRRDVLERAAELGVRDVVSKPFELDALLGAIARYCSGG